EALLLAGLGEVLFNFAVRCLLLVATILWFQLPVHATVALVPIGALALIAFGMMLGLLLTPLSMLFQDIGRGLTMITSFWMLLTPIVYPPPRSGAGAVLAQWNPVSPLVTCTREWLTLGFANHQSQFVIIVVTTIVLLFIGWLIYRLTMPIIIERLGG
ncbi:MAG TPA: ABC transporter permease, partial [Verrucomicrobiota bacterium]|nr:ABC transporter permease [Verrucomicrobiota bacterium]